jgi:hypothetical protein
MRIFVYLSRYLGSEMQGACGSQSCESRVPQGRYRLLASIINAMPGSQKLPYVREEIFHHRMNCRKLRIPRLAKSSRGHHIRRRVRGAADHGRGRPYVCGGARCLSRPTADEPTGRTTAARCRRLRAGRRRGRHRVLRRGSGVLPPQRAGDLPRPGPAMERPHVVAGHRADASRRRHAAARGDHGHARQQLGGRQ